MARGYIALTEALLSLRRCSGRLLQIEGRLGMASAPAVAQAAMPEVRDVRFAVNAAMDQLVLVQAELPEPSIDDIAGYYNPDAVDVKTAKYPPLDMRGIPEGKPIKAHLGKAEPAFIASDEVLKATYDLLSLVDGDPPEPDDDCVFEAVGDGRPAGWTEALALEFIGTRWVDSVDQFAKAFNEGDWPMIQKEWPEFQTWLNGKAKYGAKNWGGDHG